MTNIKTDAVTSAPKRPVLSKTTAPTSPFVLSPVAPKIQNLENRDLFFSNSSARAKIERFLNTPNLQQLCFNLSQNDSNTFFQKLFQASHVALIMKKLPSVEKADKNAKNHADVAKNTASSKLVPPDKIQVELVHYRPLQQVPVLIKLLAAVSQKLPLLEARHFAYNPKHDTIHPEAEFEQAGITQQSSPWTSLGHMLKKGLDFLLPGSDFLRVDDQGVLRIGSRWAIPLETLWQNKEGIPLQYLTALRLPNHQIGEVISQTLLETINSSALKNNVSKKLIKEKLIQHLEQTEQLGYTLVNDPLPAASKLELTPKTAPRPLPTANPLQIPPQAMASSPFKTGTVFKAANTAPPNS